MKLALAALMLSPPAALGLGGWFSSSAKSDPAPAAASSVSVDETEEEEAEEEAPRRRLQASGTFKALTCNGSMQSPCDAFTSVVSAYTDAEGVFTVPCGKCVDVDVTDPTASSYTFTGMNLLGNLNVGPAARVTFQTPYVFVQGGLSVDQSTDPTPIGPVPNVAFDMIDNGTGPGASNFLIPHEENAAVCPPGGCDVGPKSIVVAGGTLDLRGMNEACPAWSYVRGVTVEGAPNPTSGVPTPDTPPLESCSSRLVESTFEGDIDGWYGNLGAEETHVTPTDESNYLSIVRRTANWQGPYFELTGDEHRPCLKSGATYFFRAKVKLTPGESNPDHVSQCSSVGVNCPQMRLQYMKENNYVVWRDLIDLAPTFRPIDGEWFSLEGPFRMEDEFTLESNVFVALSIDGPEPEVDVSADDVVVELAPANAFPNPANVCDDMMVNGAADKFGGVPFPFHSYIPKTKIYVKELDGNPAFYVPGRDKTFDTLAINLIPSCLVPDTTYSFSIRTYVDTADTSVTPKILVKTHKDGQQPGFDSMDNVCPETSVSKGWSDCTVQYTWTAEHYNADRVEIFVNLPEDKTADAYFDDVSLTFVDGAGSAGVHLDEAVTSDCYGPETRVVIPSNDLSYDRAQEVTLSGVASPGTVTIAEVGTRFPTATAESEAFAGQMAFMGRKIGIYGEGGSLRVMGTELGGPIGTIMGVMFEGFGQAGVAGGSPISFTNSNAQYALVKNSISRSKNRCVDLWDTSNVLAAENVAYDAEGHCFAVGPNSQNNNLISNLGALTRKASVPILGANDDTEASTFYMGNPANTWSANVAGGSERHGFLLETSLTEPLGRFDGNRAHSNVESGICVKGYAPSNLQTFRDTNSFRNSNTGLQIIDSTSVEFNDGNVADNRHGIEIISAGGGTNPVVDLANLKISGQTPGYKGLASFVDGTPVLCTGYASGPAVDGLVVHPNNAIVWAQSLHFSGFTSADGCQPSSGDTAAIGLITDDATADPAFTSSVHLAGITFEDGSDPEDEVKICVATDNGYVGIVLQDSDGGLNPAMNGHGTIIGPGVACSVPAVPMPGTCASYCTGEASEAAPTPAPEPGSEPAAVEVVETTCLTNGGFESGFSGWTFTRAEWEMVQPGKGGGSAVRVFDRVHQARGGIYQDISSYCLEIDSWYEVSADIRMLQKSSLTPHICDPGVMWYNQPGSCAFFTLMLDKDSNTRVEVGSVIGPLVTEGEAWNRISGGFLMTPEIAAYGDFPIFIGSAPEDVDLVVDNVSIKKVVDVANSLVAVDCERPILNGDFETGDYRDWHVRGTGEGGQLEMVTGFGGTGSAVRHFNRPSASEGSEKWHGIIQTLPMSCFDKGETWTIQAKFRFFDPNGTPVMCDKSDPRADDSCPTFKLLAGGVVESGALTNIDPGEAVVGEWNVITNVFVVPDGMIDGGYKDMWLFINGVPPAHIYEIDDIAMYKGYPP